MTITVFALLPVAAIVVLYVVTNPVQRLGLVAVFTAGFSLVVRIAGSKVRTIEVFAATAAYVLSQILKPRKGTDVVQIRCCTNSVYKSKNK